MPDENSDVSLRQIADKEDIEFLENAAAGLGITVEQLAKELIERRIVAKTRPKTMSGPIQAFRRAYMPTRRKPDEGLKSAVTQITNTKKPTV